MSFSWYFHSFNALDLENQILKGEGKYPTEEGVDTIDPKIRAELRNAAFNYNKLNKKYWKQLDQYLTNSILALKETTQVSPDHAHWRVWSELSGLDSAEPIEIFDALSGIGRRYNYIEEKKSYFSKFKSTLQGLTGKNGPDYIIILEDELKILISSLEEIFAFTDDAFFENLGGKEELRPYFLEPFVQAYEEGKAILGILT